MTLLFQKKKQHSKLLSKVLKEQRKLIKMELQDSEKFKKLTA